MSDEENKKIIHIPVTVDTSFIQKKLTDDIVDGLLDQICMDLKNNIEHRLIHEKDFNGASKLKNYVSRAVKDLIDENKDYIIEEAVKRVSVQVIRDKKYNTQSDKR